MITSLRTTLLKISISLVIVISFFYLLKPLLTFFQQYTIFLDVVINGHYQISDSSGHYDCIQGYTKFIFSGANNEIDTWCLRRPTYPLLMTFPNIFLQSSVTGIIIFQLILSTMLAIFLYHFLNRFDKSYKFAYLTLIPILVLIQFRFAISIGPESLSLNLAIGAIIFLLRFIKDQEINFLIYSFTFSLLAFEVRPGNPVFIILFLVILLYKISKSKIISTYLRKLLSIIFIIIVLPRMLFKIFGIEDGYNGGNFWATFYSLVSPTANSWSDAYVDFAHLTEGRNEVYLWDIVRTESIRILLEDPSTALNQFFHNVFIFFQYSPITLSTGVSRTIELDLTNYLVFLLFILIAIYFILFLILILNRIVDGDFSSGINSISSRYDRTGKKNRQVSTVSTLKLDRTMTVIHNVLIGVLIYFYLISEMLGDGLLFTRLKTGSNIVGFHIQGLAVLTIFSVLLVFLKRFNRKKENLTLLDLMVVLNIAGAAIFFGFVGHDEFMRHQAQNIPLYLLTFLTLYRNNKSNV